MTVLPLGQAEQANTLAVLRAFLTYKYLRVIVPFPAVMILIGLAIEFSITRTWRQSISSYYEGPVRDLFVGGLIATAICLIAYKGESKFEDMALNFAGFNAILVALMPSNLEQVLSDPDPAHRPGGLTSDQFLQFSRLVLVALLVLALLFVFLDQRLFSPEGFDWDSQPGLAKLLIICSVITEAVLLVEVLTFILTGSTIVLGLGWIHNLAAIFLIMNLSFAVASHGWPERLKVKKTEPGLADDPDPQPGGGHQRGRDFYRWFAVVMWLTLLGGGIMIIMDFVRHIQDGHWVIVEECLGIGFFIVFWFYASRDVWKSVTLKG